MVEAMRRRFLVGATALAAAVGLSACSGGGAPAAAHPPSGTPHDVLLASATRTATTSAHLSLKVSISGTPSLGALGGGSGSSSAHSLSGTIAADGDFDFATKAGDMSLTIPAFAGGQDHTVEFRIVGQTIYLSAPGLSSADGGKPWLSVDLSSYESAAGSGGPSPLGGLTSGDPTQVLQLLDQIGAQVTEIGSATVDGVPTTQYQATVDLSKLGGQTAGAGAGSGLGRQFAQALGLGSVPISVWVDNEGQARQVEMNLSFLGIHVDLSLDLSHFGEAVSVTVPPADQVADGSSLLQGGGLKSILGSTV
jgi:lipoprotein LprG